MLDIDNQSGGGCEVVGVGCVIYGALRKHNCLTTRLRTQTPKSLNHTLVKVVGYW